MSLQLTEFLKEEQYKELEGKHRLTHPNHQGNALQLRQAAVPCNYLVHAWVMDISSGTQCRTLNNWWLWHFFKGKMVVMLSLGTMDPPIPEHTHWQHLLPEFVCIILYTHMSVQLFFDFPFLAWFCHISSFIKVPTKDCWILCYGMLCYALS